MKIPQSFIDNLLARVDIVELIDSYVPLKKAGKEYMALCPFHSEKTASFSVNQDRQLYYCFGCGAAGNLISFLMEHLNLDFMSAIEELADRVGLEIPKHGGADNSAVSRDESKRLYGLMAKVVNIYKRNLNDPKIGKQALHYLRERAVSDAIIAEYAIGYATPDWDGVLRELGGNNESVKSLEKLGLVIKHDKGHYYDRFRDRIIFPIQDRRGRFIGFGGRIVEDTAAGKSAKYLNSPDTVIFSKGNELYGLYQANKTKYEELYVVEGYMDVVALAQHKVSNSVAVLGTAVTRKHIENYLSLAINWYCVLTAMRLVIRRRIRQWE